MYLFQSGQTIVELPVPKYQAASGVDLAAAANSASSPTPGVLERVLVQKGDKVYYVNKNINGNILEKYLYYSLHQCFSWTLAYYLGLWCPLKYLRIWQQFYFQCL